MKKQIIEEELLTSNSPTKKKQRQKQIKKFCEPCNKWFVNKYVLNYHLRSVHGVKPYPCTKCSKTYEHVKDMEDHFKRVHMGLSSSDLQYFKVKELEPVSQKKKNQQCNMNQIHNNDNINKIYNDENQSNNNLNINNNKNKNINNNNNLKKRKLNLFEEDKLFQVLKQQYKNQQVKIKDNFRICDDQNQSTTDSIHITPNNKENIFINNNNTNNNNLLICSSTLYSPKQSRVKSLFQHDQKQEESNTYQIQVQINLTQGICKIKDINSQQISSRCQYHQYMQMFQIKKKEMY